MKKALITGITGQDGAYLAELLLAKGYEVHGLKRRSSLFNTDRIDHLYQDLHEDDVKFKLHYGDLSDSGNLIRIVQEIPQSEKTPFYPRSPYAVAKLYSYWITVNYREAYNLYACNGILFNHESPMRGETFVTRKITRAACRIALGLQQTVFMGNIDSKRDWGHAKDYVEAMWLMLQQNSAEDFVIATGVTTTVREFIIIAFKELGITLQFSGEGLNEKAVITKSENPDFAVKVGQEVVKIDPRYFRPTEVELLIGNPAKAKSKLGWKPKYDLHALVSEMVSCDLQLFKRDHYLKEGGHKIFQYHE